MNAPAGANPPAVVLDGIGKTYRLYQAPMYRVLDLLGLCPATSRYYTEHDALKSVSLRIDRGEKVAIIGRNGAGKSTLLKIITGTVRPSRGTIELNGSVSALLQIGTGFHPDFTGRQNVYSGFAHMGITGRRADELFREVVEFSELHEFIDQPMKTYSTGMGARLMFSAATVLEPELLVIDELLGVGDAYFAHKSYERMQQMCSRSGTTLLLVTHDVYSAINLCERFVWIDRGTVRLDGDPKTVVNAYENSVKEQEEERLRKRHAAARAALEAGERRWRVRLASRSGFALPAPFAVAELALEVAGGHRTALPVAESAEGWTLLPEGNLGEPTRMGGRRCRVLGVHGSIFHKAEWIVELPPGSEGAAPSALEATIRYDSRADDQAELSLVSDTGTVVMRRVVSAAEPGSPEAGWRIVRFETADAGANVAAADARGQYGTGLVRIERIDFLDPEHRPVVRVRHGEPLAIEVALRLEPELEEREVTWVVGFHKAGAAVGGYVHRERLALPDGVEQCTVTTRLDRVTLGSGQWLVTVGVAEPEFYRQAYNPFFSVNERWHHLIARGFELAVDSADAIDPAAFVLVDATVEVSPAPAPAGAEATSAAPS